MTPVLKKRKKQFYIVTIIAGISSLIQIIIGIGIMARLDVDGHTIGLAAMRAYWLSQFTVLLAYIYAPQRFIKRLPYLNQDDLNWLQVILSCVVIMLVITLINGILDALNTFTLDARYIFSLCIDLGNLAIAGLIIIDAILTAPRIKKGF